MSGFDHIALSFADYATSLAFYESALGPLGIKTLMKFEDDGGKIAGMGAQQPIFWVGDGGAVGGRVHIAFQAKNRAEVDAFYAAAIAAGGKDNGPPGLRTNYHANYYAAYVFDPDGHNIEAVYQGPV
ncbi:MAG: VOC family protein [Devosia sp.]